MPCSKGMVKCKSSCLHRDMVQGYRCARASAEAERERVCMGYQTEEREYDEKIPRTIFRRWIEQWRRDEPEPA